MHSAHRVLYVTNAYRTRVGAIDQGALRRHDRLVRLRPCPRIVPASNSLSRPGLQAGNYQAEYRIVPPDGRMRWVREREFASRDADGQVSRIWQASPRTLPSSTTSRTACGWNESAESFARFAGAPAAPIGLRDSRRLYPGPGRLEDVARIVRPNLPAENTCLIARLDKIEVRGTRRLAKGGE